MSKETRRVPKLRFPGFTEDWEQRKFGEIMTFLNGRAYKQEELLDEGKYRVLRVGNFNTNSKWYYSNLELEDNKYVNKGDLLYLWATNFGPEIWTEEKAIYHYHIWKLEFDKTDINQDYLYIWLESDKNKIQQNTNGSTMVHITKNMMEERRISLPSQDEQSAIGSLFRTLDDLLSSYKDNLANYQSLKTTMLSKMFPKAGQRVPEIRLDGFEGEWEIKKFKSISNKRGKSNSKGYDYPAYSVSNQNGLIPQSEQFEGSRLENLEKTSYKIVEPNEFAYNPARINVGSIAFNDLDETVIVSSLYVIFSLDKSINNNYALLFIKSPEFNKEVRRNTEGSVREYLFYENFANIRLPIPPSLDEQQAIGSYFSNLDNLINSHQEKIFQLEILKKKLLQDMFI